MPYCRKKPVIVRYDLWEKNGDHPFDACEVFHDKDGSPFMGEGKVVRYFRRPDVPGDTECRHCGRMMHFHGWIDTLEGGHVVCPGDYVITGVKGERYPIKRDIWEATYDDVDPNAPSPEQILADVTRAKDMAYRERNMLVCALSKLFPSSLERHSDEDRHWDNDWRWIVFIDLPTGQATWHIHDRELTMFDHLPRGTGRVWDGHTNEVKYDRVLALSTVWGPQ